MIRFAETFWLVAACTACGKNSAPPKVTEVTGHMDSLSIPVGGMAGERCASRVQRALTALDGVGDAEVSREHELVVVHYDRHKLSAGRLAAAINGAGFKAGPVEATR